MKKIKKIFLSPILLGFIMNLFSFFIVFCFCFFSFYKTNIFYFHSFFIISSSYFAIFFLSFFYTKIFKKKFNQEQIKIITFHGMIFHFFLLNIGLFLGEQIFFDYVVGNFYILSYKFISITGLNGFSRVFLEKK